MKTYNRRSEIFHYITMKKNAKISELKDTFQVSEVTIRSDLDALEAEGKIERTHGGASLIEKQDPTVPELPNTPLLEAKIMIAKKAMELINSGDTLFLDSSATSIVAASFLSAKSNIAVITNSLPIINIVKHMPEIKLYAIPGLFDASTNSFNGPLGESFISRLKTSKAFISPKGIIEEGLRDLTADEAAIRRAMIEYTKEAIIMADHSKFNNIEILFQISDFAKVSTVVTNQPPARPFLDIFEARDIKLMIPDAPADLHVANRS